MDRPHQSPEGWANDINPAKGLPSGVRNCGECARAVQETWTGTPSTAAEMVPGMRGEHPGMMDYWAGEYPQPATMDQISQRLTDLGPGSSAIVRCLWDPVNGHYFNAVNDKGTIKAVDGQSGRVETWPPSCGGLGFDESYMKDPHAFYFDSRGNTVR